MGDSGMAGKFGVATLHRVRGVEPDVVIFDICAAPPRRQVGLLLQGGLGTPAARLLNVAISRSRGKLVIVCDHAFTRATSHSDTLLRPLLNCIDPSSVRELSPRIVDILPMVCFRSMSV